jgi:cation transport ATPase
MKPTPASKDLILKTAKKRVQFKQHMIIFILLNLLLWVVYFFLFRGKHTDDNTFLQVNLFILITWAIILIGHYFYAMKWNKQMVEKEVQALIKETMTQKEDKMVNDVVKEN